VTLDSALSDVISIEARPLARRRIEFRIRDENEDTYRWSPSNAKQPLSLRELIILMDSAKGPTGKGLVRGPLNYNCVGGAKPPEFARFVEVTSKFYADLVRHYQAEVLRWIEEKSARKR
jgi:hypothetical protein